VAEVDDRVDEAARQLYAVPPDEFMARRTELAKQARTDGNGAAAARIEKLRKPTQGAWLVNALALDDPSVAERLTDLGDRLRASQDRLDAGALRELTTERRALVADLTKQALARAGRKQPPAGLRDEVSGTFEAAIADPDVAARLGRLQRSEQWSGFGFLPTGAPQLTVVRGEKGRAAKDGAAAEDGRKPAAKASAPKKSAAERRRLERDLTRARTALEEAEAGFSAAQGSERELSQKLKQLGRRLAKLQDELEKTRGALDAARKDVTASRARRRDARTALDRAERAARD
jgi:hypothetical protein